MLVGARITEIGEHPVAHVFGDKPAGALDDRCDAAMIGADHSAQIFRIEARRQCRRTDEIAEQHRQLPPLGLRCWRRRRQLPRLLRSGQRRGALAQRCNGFEELAAIAHLGDAEILEILRGQLGQYRGVDAVIAKRRLVLL
jgi:hypothetical protein